ncbi:CUL1 [Acrasis kona]|uniref:CUL1 n=1 Tax=Acrasis kona TaxID=1008807 RepID=A0AAW2YTN2_9EUKA
MTESSMSIVRDDFCNNKDFIKCVHHAIQFCMNENPSKSAKSLSKYCHVIMKPDFESSHSTIEQIIDQIAVLFRLIHDCDVFLNMYSIWMASRLLSNSYNEQRELLMISKLKQSNVNSHTYKLQRMLSDMNFSTQLNEDYKQEVSSGGFLHATILTYVSWPLSYPNQSMVNLPRIVHDELEVFSDFYQTKHTGRKLIWIYSLSKFILKTNYHLPMSKSYELQVTTDQLSILLQLNEQDSVPYNNSIDADALTKSKILLREDENLLINYNFKSKKHKIGLGGSKKIAVQETFKSLSGLSEDRKYALQAAIIRIMKSKKSMEHDDLVRNVLQQVTSFRPQTSDVKRSINALIEQEYIKRDENVTSMYKYIS